MQQANEFLFKLCSGRHALIGPHKPSYFSRGLTSHRPTKTAIEIRYLLIRLLSSSCPVRSSSMIQPIVYILQQFNASQYFSFWLPALALMILDFHQSLANTRLSHTWKSFTHVQYIRPRIYSTRSRCFSIVLNLNNLICNQDLGCLYSFKNIFNTCILF